MKRLFVAALALLLSVGAFAEGFGLVGGFTSSQMEMKDVNFKSSAGIHAGLAYNLPLGAGFALQPELLYNVKGFNWGAESSDVLKEKAKFGYVELPVQLQWGLDLVMLRPYVLAEPFVGYAVSGKKVLGGTEAKVDWEGMKSRLEYGLGIGAGIEVYNRIQVAFKYYWNFEDATQWNQVSDKVKAKSFSGLVFTAGIFF
ncbi:MAG: PorT family protein [Bacteroidales bacterium]|nr:PorT family protein [Bacteroidales bacterium]